MAGGNFDLYASKVENYFTDPPLVALEEYGIPLQVGKKLRPHFMPVDDLDAVLGRLWRLSLERTGLSNFEKELVADAQKTL